MMISHLDFDVFVWVFTNRITELHTMELDSINFIYTTTHGLVCTQWVVKLFEKEGDDYVLGERGECGPDTEHMNEAAHAICNE